MLPSLFTSPSTSLPDGAGDAVGFGDSVGFGDVVGFGDAVGSAFGILVSPSMGSP